MKKNIYVEVANDTSKEVAYRSRSVDQRSAETILRGVSINMAHTNWTARIVKTGKKLKPMTF